MHAKSLQSFLTLQSHGLQPTRLLCSWDSLGRNTGVGCRALLQGIFPTQGSNLPLLRLLHWQARSLPLAPLWEALISHTPIQNRKFTKKKCEDASLAPGHRAGRVKAVLSQTQRSSTEDRSLCLNSSPTCDPSFSLVLRLPTFTTTTNTVHTKWPPSSCSQKDTPSCKINSKRPAACSPSLQCTGHTKAGLNSSGAHSLGTGHI